MAKTAPTVNQLLAKREEHLEAVNQIEAELKKILDQIQHTLNGKAATKSALPANGRRKVRRAKRAKRRKIAEVSQADKEKFMVALKALVKDTGKDRLRLGEVGKKAGLKGKELKAVKAALLADKSIPNSGAWIRLP